MRRSRNARRRAAVLIGVHALIAIHIGHWLVRGRTMSPVEPSESMRTFEFGEVNAGAIFFAAAILSTLVFGRFFCGWGCHIVALQDLCAWLLKKMGVRPKVFRSRVLVFIPLVLALYMFVWPTLKRVAIAPLLEPVWPTIRQDMGIAPFPVDGFSSHLSTEEFWATFPGVLVAIPFLFICGFACVYFLGAKGFCTYGCPYGGIFGPIDRVSVGRIVVDHDKCHQCGHCTAVCTSNVRVHDEIREFGMVVSPGCMKCMDCVSVCPNSALSFRFALPSIAAGPARHAPPKRVFDTTIGEDAALACLFLAVLLSVRGAYELIPLLMAVGIACCAMVIGWKTWRLFRDRDVRLGPIQLKQAGRLTRGGIGFAGVVAALALLTAHSGLVNYHRWRGDAAFEGLGISRAALLAPGAPHLSGADADRARSAIAHYDRASGATESRGGLGFFTPIGSSLRTSLLHLALGNRTPAEASMRAAVALRPDDDELTADFSRFMRLQGGRDDEALSMLDSLIRREPASWRSLEEMAQIRLARADHATAMILARQSLANLPESSRFDGARGRTMLTLARLTGASGDPSGALRLLKDAAGLRPSDSVILENYAAALEQIARDPQSALEQLDRAIVAAPARAELRFQRGRLLLEKRDSLGAIEALDAAIARSDRESEMRSRIAALLRHYGLEAEARARQSDGPSTP